MSYFGTLKLADGGQLDAFNRLRVSEPVTLFEDIGLYWDNTLLFESIAQGGSVAHQAGKVAVRLSNGGTTAANYAARSSKVYHRYQAAKSQMILMTFTMSAAQAGAAARIGYYDFADGFFFEKYGTTVNLGRRSSTATDLVTNGKLTTDVTGWTGSGATPTRTTAFGGGEMTVTTSGAAAGYAYQAITTVIGVRYVLSAIVRRGTAANAVLAVGTTATGGELGYKLTVNDGDTATRQGDTLSLVFTASGTTTYVTCGTHDTAGTVTAIFDNITCAAVDTVVAQASWNIDTMVDGTGPSGKTLDLTKAQILVIDLQYLGVGRCRMGFDIDGMVYYCHEFNWANTGAGVYMGQGGSLPVRAEVSNFGTAGGTVTLDWHCSAVMSECGQDDAVGLTFAANNGAAGSGSISAERSVIGIRAARELNGTTFRGQLIYMTADIAATSNSVLWTLQLNPVAVLTWAAYNATYSGAEVTTTVAAISTPGVVVNSGVVPASAVTKGQGQVTGTILLPVVYSGLKNVQESLVLVATPLTGSATVNASLVWIEVP